MVVGTLASRNWINHELYISESWWVLTYFMHRALTPSDQGSAAGGGSVTGGAAAQPDAECFFILSIGYIYIMIVINGCLKLLWHLLMFSRCFVTLKNGPRRPAVQWQWLENFLLIFDKFNSGAENEWQLAACSSAATQQQTPDFQIQVATSNFQSYPIVDG